MEPVLLLVLAGAALGYGLVLREGPPGPVRTLVKTLPAAGLAAWAWTAGAPPFLVAALAFGAAGDAALAQAGRNAFLLGLAAFLAEHLCLLQLFLAEGGGAAALTGWRLFAALVLVAFAAFYTLWLWPYLGPLRGPALAYLAVLTAMGVAALTLPAERWPAIVGAWLFLESDSALAFETFVLPKDHPARRATGHAAWWTYCGAQGAIAAAWLWA
ncbi:MAG TPA: lysoplasmalogenase family protein [Paracoccaceae bacterium]|nr:lysoplasmalogenase family protein [Paracoccaceae bacterium]